MVVTDQDGAMKRAIEAILTESTHRLCMWHIMQKVPAKICPEIYDETDFKERFSKLMWNMFMEPLEFEGKWSKLVEDLGLQNHKWITKMFDLRHMWLPTYFIHSPLFGLMRTRSRSESENAFFKNFTNHGSTLVNFMMCFESAMERQCYRQEVLDFRTFDSARKLHTKLTIEIHACKLVTLGTISLLFQNGKYYEECWACQIQEFKKEEGCEIVRKQGKVVDSKVVRNPEDGSVECTCRHFLRYGFLCRHVFCVLKNCNIEVIPERYILRRWRRDLIPPALRRNTNRYGEKDEAIEKLTNEANFVVKVPNPPSQKTGDVIEDIYAIKKPKQNLVNNPQKASNKGGRRGERRKSGREIAMNSKAKRARKCRYCAEKTNKHTKNTCPLNPKYIAKLARTEAAAEQERRTAASATE
ncbi:FAR1 DNA binding domain, zinc finger, SWIM-type, MULE transposase domain containing protein [Tanacetum coccineum]